MEGVGSMGMPNTGVRQVDVSVGEVFIWRLN